MQIEILGEVKRDVSFMALMYRTIRYNFGRAMDVTESCYFGSDFTV